MREAQAHADSAFVTLESLMNWRHPAPTLDESIQFWKDSIKDVEGISSFEGLVNNKEGFDLRFGPMGGIDRTVCVGKTIMPVHTEDNRVFWGYPVQQGAHWAVPESLLVSYTHCYRTGTATPHRYVKAGLPPSFTVHVFTYLPDRVTVYVVGEKEYEKLKKAAVQYRTHLNREIILHCFPQRAN
jgi:hypothetical protein